MVCWYAVPFESKQSSMPRAVERILWHWWAGPTRHLHHIQSSNTTPTDPTCILLNPLDPDSLEETLEERDGDRSHQYQSTKLLPAEVIINPFASLCAE